MAPVDTRNPRATAVRKKTWQPPNLLPDPNPSDEWDYHWVRVATLGDPDIPNVSVRQIRSGVDPRARLWRYGARRGYVPA